MNHAIAVQPSAWGKFDPHGCDWAKDMNHAFRIAQQWGEFEECMIWMVPASGEPMRWCRADHNTNAIADLVFGVNR